MDGVKIRRALPEEWVEAMNLAWKTFLRFEAEDYTPAGAKSFYKFITDPKLEAMFLRGEYLLFCAFLGDRMIGMAGVRDQSHVSLLFVDEAYHRQGVASGLLRQVFKHCFTVNGASRITVNSSPYATGFYHRLGFQDMSIEQAADGIRYTPMAYRI